MLIPRFSIRSLLLLTTACAFLFLLLSFSVRGHFWARAIWAGLASVMVSFGLYAVFFLGAFLLASLFGVVRRPKAASPFATDRPPPQVIAPIEVD